MIAPTDRAVARAARERIDALTKPVGSLGRMETLAVQLCAIAGGVPSHRFERRAVLVIAADHGVAAEGVSAYPPDVTAQMVAGFCAGTAAVSAFARAMRAEVFVADAGVRTPSPPHPRLIDVRVGPGTANLAHGPAMTPAEFDRALAAGAAAFEVVEKATQPLAALALGDMGIGNTTSAAAMIAAFTQTPPRLVVGRGTGVDDDRLARKTAIVEHAVARLSGTLDPRRVGSEIGGFEIVALAGAMRAAAQAGVVVVLDGLIVTAAALLARALDPACVDYMIASHRSAEPGHIVALRALGLEPLYDLDLRLGEASGAVLAFGLIEAATRMVAEMMTFAQAGVATAVETLPTT